MYAFWAIAEGIIIGGKSYFIGTSFAIIMTIVVVILYKLNGKKSKRMLLIVKHNAEFNITEFEEKLKTIFKKYYLKEQKIAEEGEIMLEVKSTNNQLNIKLNELQTKGVIEISFIDYIEPTI